MIIAKQLQIHEKMCPLGVNFVAENKCDLIYVSQKQSVSLSPGEFQCVTRQISQFAPVVILFFK